MGLFVSLFINALALLVTTKVVPGISVDSWITLVVATIVIAVVNTFIKPIVQLISLPLTLLTLGIFALVVNAAMLILVSWLVPGFSVSGFWSAVFGTIVLSLTSTVLSTFVVKPQTSNQNL